MARKEAGIGVSEVRSAVARLLAEAGVSKAPVDLAKVAAVQGVSEITHGKLRKALGTLTNKSGSLRITLNTRWPHRWRFTLAHEIAHTMLEPRMAPEAVVTIDGRKPKRGQPLERLCDQVATEILLPYEMFERALGENAPDIERIERLAKQFDASLQATARRVGEVSFAPVQVLVWGKRPEGDIAVQMKSGRPYLTGQGAIGARRFSDRESAIVRAHSSKEMQTGDEMPVPESTWEAYRCEAKGYSSGRSRFVVSVVTPLAIEAPSARRSRATSTPDKAGGLSLRAATRKRRVAA